MADRFSDDHSENAVSISGGGKTARTFLRPTSVAEQYQRGGWDRNNDPMDVDGSVPNMPTDEYRTGMAGFHDHNGNYNVAAQQGLSS